MLRGVRCDLSTHTAEALDPCFHDISTWCSNLDPILAAKLVNQDVKSVRPFASAIRDQEYPLYSGHASRRRVFAREPHQQSFLGVHAKVPPAPALQHVALLLQEALHFAF